MAPAVLGVRVHGDTVKNVEVPLDSSFKAVPFPTKLGVPLVYKKMSGTGGDDSHIRSNVIVRMMADPDSGLAPPEWQYGGRLGPAPPVLLARRDCVPFSEQDWATLDEYLGVWLDKLSEAEELEHAATEETLNPKAFRTFVRAQREERPTAFLSELFPPKSVVVAQGLAAAELNGVEGEVVQYSRDRVGVRFPDRGVTALRPERLALVREAPEVGEPDAKREDTGASKEGKAARQAEVQRQEAMQIAKRFVECLHQDTFPEMGDLNLFGLGCYYHVRSQQVLAVWQGAVKNGDITEEQLGEALLKGTQQELFMKTCRRLAASRTPNSTYANELIQANFGAVDWDTL